MSDKAKADQAVALARKGEDFAKLVKKFSEDPEAIQTGGKTGLVPKGNFPDYDEIAFSLALGQVSDPFQVPRGWAVVKVEQIEAPQPMPYASAAQLHEDENAGRPGRKAPQGEAREVAQGLHDQDQHAEPEEGGALEDAAERRRAASRRSGSGNCSEQQQQQQQLQMPR